MLARPLLYIGITVLPSCPTMAFLAPSSGEYCAENLGYVHHCNHYREFQRYRRSRLNPNTPNCLTVRQEQRWQIDPPAGPHYLREVLVHRRPDPDRTHIDGDAIDLG